MIARYWKAVVAFLGTVFVVIQTAITDGMITEAEWITIAITFATALGVLLKANKPAVEPAVVDVDV